MAAKLSGYTHTCIISFIDLYEKVKRNFPEAKMVSSEFQVRLTSSFVENGRRHGMVIKPCGESRSLEKTGADCSGCMTVGTFETAIGQNLKVPPNPNNRKECACYLTGDIGAYNTCGHLCRYCYANADKDILIAFSSSLSCFAFAAFIAFAAFAFSAFFAAFFRSSSSFRKPFSISFSVSSHQ